MEIESDRIISTDSYERYGVSDRRRISNERVRDFLEGGLETQDKIYERFTETLVHAVVVNSQTGLAELSSIKESFQKLLDPQTGYLSEQKFFNFLSEHFCTIDFSGLSDIRATLFGILAWHAAFPFPALNSTIGSPVIDEGGFIRAICLLTRIPAPRFAKFSGALYGTYSGYWGPHYGFLISTRGKDARDLRRHLFRSLAIPLPVGTVAETKDMDPLTKIPVARFLMNQSREKKKLSESSVTQDHSDTGREVDEDPDDLGQQVVVVAEEDERYIDLQDILAECPPEEVSLTTNPLRESYGLVLPTLARQPYYLHEMCIPSPRLISLLRLLSMADPGSENGHEQQDLVKLINSLLNDGIASGDEEKAYVCWKKFDDSLSRNTEFVAQTLSTFFSIFKYGSA